LAKEGRMLAFRHRGFWQPADTVKERTALEAAYQGGTRPWMLWENQPGGERDRDPLQAAIAQFDVPTGPLPTVGARREARNGRDRMAAS
jgi:hypothetical protein